MSTRSNIVIHDYDDNVAYCFYRHHDGYPLHGSGVLCDLYEILTYEKTKLEFYRDEKGWSKTRNVPTGERVATKGYDGANLIDRIITASHAAYESPVGSMHSFDFEFEGVVPLDNIWNKLHGDLNYAYQIHIKEGQAVWIEVYEVGYEHEDPANNLSLIWEGLPLSIVRLDDDLSLNQSDSNKPAFLCGKPRLTWLELKMQDIFAGAQS